MSGRRVVTAARCRFWAGLLVLGLACSAGVGAQTQYSPKQQTGPFVPVKDGALIWDASTGLVWMRCAVGQTWNGAACVRDSSSFNLFSLQQARSLPDRFNAGGGWLGHADWKLPTIDELESLVQCRDDTKRTFRGDGFICYSHDKPTIDATFFPNILKEENSSLFRTSSSLLIDFANGSKMNAYAADHRPYFVRLVRTRLMVDDAAVSEIIPDWIKYQQEIGNGNHLVQWVSKIDKQASKRADVDSQLILKLVTARYAALEAQELASALSSTLLPMAPVSSSPTVAPKGEFETTAQYEVRRAASLKAAEDRFSAATQRYQTAQAQRTQAEAQVKARFADPSTRQLLMAKAWQQALPDYLGSPVLTQIRYDADRQVFNAVLTSSKTSWHQEVTVPAPLNQAQALKADLESGKIAPIVTFAVPQLKAEWSLVENAALRASRFASARASIPELESFIVEYPSSPEAPLARARVFELSKNSIQSLERFVANYPNSPDVPAARKRLFDLATSSQELVDQIQKRASWPEVTAARARLAAVQKAEFDQARSSDSATAWQSFIDKLAGPDTQKLIPEAQRRLSVARSREAAEQREREVQWERDRPRREARQLCEAQKATCLASCPRDQVLTTQLDSTCKSRCESVSCY